MQPGQLSAGFDEAAMHVASGDDPENAPTPVTINAYADLPSQQLQADGATNLVHDLSAHNGQGMTLLLVLGDYGVSFGYHVLALRPTFNNASGRADQLIGAENVDEGARLYQTGRELFETMYREDFLDAAAGYFSVLKALIGGAPAVLPPA